MGRNKIAIPLIRRFRVWRRRFRTWRKRLLVLLYRFNSLNRSKYNNLRSNHNNLNSSNLPMTLTTVNSTYSPTSVRMNELNTVKSYLTWGGT